SPWITLATSIITNFKPAVSDYHSSFPLSSSHLSSFSCISILLVVFFCSTASSSSSASNSASVSSSEESGKMSQGPMDSLMGWEGIW
ncbi:hypothetical protein Leryth_026892, partial [Lithospermum erythrorhizon]